jgi:hypothetical protein
MGCVSNSEVIIRADSKGKIKSTTASVSLTKDVLTYYTPKCLGSRRLHKLRSDGGMIWYDTINCRICANKIGRIVVQNTHRTYLP